MRPLTLLLGALSGVALTESAWGGSLGPWTMVDLTDRAAFSAIATSRAQPGKLWAAGVGGGMWSSDDRGDSWHPADAGLPACATLRILVASASDPDVVYAGSSTTLFRTTNGGASWSVTGGQPGGAGSDSLTSLVVHPTDPTMLWVGIAHDAVRGVWKSTDAGATWTQTSLPSVDVWALAGNPQNGQRLAAATSIGIARSTDGGAHWDDTFLGGRVDELDWNAAQPNVVWAQRRYLSLLLRSTDFGGTWVEQGASLGDRLAVDPTDPTRLFCRFVAEGVCIIEEPTHVLSARSTDAGGTWNPDGVGEDNCGWWYDVLTRVDPFDGAHVYMAFTNKFVRSDSGGSGSWLRRMNGICMLPPTRVRQGAAGVLYVRTLGTDYVSDRLFVSSNGGVDWLDRSPSQDATAVAFEANATIPGLLHESRVFLGIDASMMRSTNGGMNWSYSNYDPRRDLIASAADGMTVYSWAGSEVWRSDNGLQSEQHVGSSVIRATSAVVDPADPHRLLAAGEGVRPVRLSTDGGVTWVDCSDGLPLAPDEAAAGLLMDLGAPAHLLVGLARHGVFESSDFGAAWQPVSLPLTRALETPAIRAPKRDEAQLTRLRCIAWDVAGGERRIFQATSAGVYVEGYGWVDEGLHGCGVTSMEYSRLSSKLFVTTNLGVYALGVPAVGRQGVEPSSSERVTAEGTPELAFAPNPFAGTAALRFSVPAAGARVHLDVVDAAGRRVRRIVDGELPQGEHDAAWDGHDAAGGQAAAGVYFFRLDVDGKVVTKQAVRLR